MCKQCLGGGVHTCALPKCRETDPAAALVQATVEAGYLVVQAVLYVCVLYFMAGFDRTAGKSNTPSPHFTYTGV